MGIAIAGSKNRCTFAAVIEKQTVANIDRDVAQLASAPRSGRGGRKFESSHPDKSCLQALCWRAIFLLKTQKNAKTPLNICNFEMFRLTLHSL